MNANPYPDDQAKYRGGFLRIRAETIDNPTLHNLDKLCWCYERGLGSDPNDPESIEFHVKLGNIIKESEKSFGIGWKQKLLAAYEEAWRIAEELNLTAESFMQSTARRLYDYLVQSGFESNIIELWRRRANVEISDRNPGDISQESHSDETAHSKYVCSICGYVFTEKSANDLPHMCPICHGPISKTKKMKERICSVCGYHYPFKESILLLPDKCPICHSPVETSLLGLKLQPWEIVAKGSGGGAKCILDKDGILHILTEPQQSCELGMIFLTKEPGYQDSELVIHRVTISPNITSISSDSFILYNKVIEAVDIPDSVTQIQDGLFRGFVKLKSINLPKTLVSIGASAFFGCKSLINVDIPENVASIGEGAFALCDNLKTISIASGNQYYRAIGNALYDIKNAKLVACPNPLTGSQFRVPEGVRSIGRHSIWGITAGDENNSSTIILPSSVDEIQSQAFNHLVSATIIFSGCAPKFEENCFEGSRLHICFIEDDPSWVESIFQDYGGEIKWIPISRAN